MFRLLGSWGWQQRVSLEIAQYICRVRHVAAVETEVLALHYGSVNWSKPTVEVQKVLDLALGGMLQK